MPDGTKERDWVDTLARLLPGLGAILAGVLIPLVIHINGERSRNNQLYAEIVSRREVSDSELRAKMFENLLKTFFGDAATDRNNQRKLSLLRLLALNFHEFFDLKPLFEDSQKEFSPAERQQLRDILTEVVEKQEAMLAQTKEVQIFRRTLGPGRAHGILVPPEGQPPYREHRLGIEVTEISPDDDYVRMRVIDIPAQTATQAETAEVSFKLNYCSLPFIDNTKLFNATRFAITFKGISYTEDRRKEATIKIIFFPETYMSSRDRPFLDEMLNQLHKPQNDR